MDLDELITYMNNMIRYLSDDGIDVMVDKTNFNEKCESTFTIFVQNDYVDHDNEDYQIEDYNVFASKIEEELKSKINSRFGSESFFQEVKMFDEYLQCVLKIKLSEDKFGKISSDFPLDRLEELIRFVDDHNYLPT